MPTPLTVSEPLTQRPQLLNEKSLDGSNIVCTLTTISFEFYTIAMVIVVWHFDLWL